jgi:hypothetical protein
LDCIWAQRADVRASGEYVILIDVSTHLKPGSEAAKLQAALKAKPEKTVKGVQQ